MERVGIFNPFHGAPVLHVRETDSTMDDARERWNREPITGLVVTTSFQRSGRGRSAGRRWESPAGESLMFTLALSEDDVRGGDGSRRRPGVGAADLPLRIGCGLAVFLRQLGVPARVKWPNDVLVFGRKIAGILVETVGGGYLVGIGLNCRQRSFAADIAQSATSLRLETAEEYDPTHLLEGVLATLRRYACGRRRSHLAPLLAGVGRTVTVRVGQDAVYGRIRGVSADGALLVATASGVRRLISGEIVRYE